MTMSALPIWGFSPNFSHSLWSASAQARVSAGEVRRAYRAYGQALRRTLSRASAGPKGCLSADIYGPMRLNRMARYAFRRLEPYLPRRKATQTTESVRNAG